MSVFEKLFGSRPARRSCVAAPPSTLYFPDVRVGNVAQAHDVRLALTSEPSVEVKWRTASLLQGMLSTVLRVDGVAVTAWGYGVDFYVALLSRPRQPFLYTFEVWCVEGQPVILKRLLVTPIVTDDPEGDAYTKYFWLLWLERGGYDANREALVHWYAKEGLTFDRHQEQLDVPLSELQLCRFMPLSATAEWSGWSRRPLRQPPSIESTGIIQHSPSGTVVYHIRIHGTWSDAALQVLHDGCRMLLPGRCVLRCIEVGDGELAVFGAMSRPKSSWDPSAYASARIVLACVARVHAIVARMYLSEQKRAVPDYVEGASIPLPEGKSPLMQQWVQAPQGRSIVPPVGGHYEESWLPSTTESWVRWRRGWGDSWSEEADALHSPLDRSAEVTWLDLVARSEAVPWSVNRRWSLEEYRRPIAGDARLPPSGQVFLSFADEDRRLAETLHEVLTASGQSCWISSRSLRAGEEYPAEIARAIRSSNTMLVLLSSHSNASKWVRREVEVADNQEIPIIPVMVDGVEPDEWLQMYVAGRQKLFVADLPHEVAARRVLEALRRREAGVEV